jgi:site-specific recombinase XerD
VKNVPLILAISYNTCELHYYTSKRVDISQWDIKNQKLEKNSRLPSGETHFDFYADLERIKVKIHDIFKYFDAHNIIPTKTQILEFLRDNKDNDKIDFEPIKDKSFFDLFKKYIKDSPCSYGRKKHFDVSYKKLIEFRPNLTFDSVDQQFLIDFRKWLFDKKKISKNTISCEIRRFRSFFSYAKKMKWTNNDPFRDFKCEGEVYGDPIYLSKAERDILYSAEIKDQRLAHVRDMFILQSFIGCRVEDYISLRRECLVNNYIQYIAGKTANNKPKTITVPLTAKAKEIISRYNEPNGDLIHFISSQKYNIYLKELFKLEEIDFTRIVVELDPKTRKNVHTRLCDMVSSHMARRNFIGNLVEAGASMETICAMSGHSKGSKAIARYFNITHNAKETAIALIE